MTDKNKKNDKSIKKTIIKWVLIILGCSTVAAIFSYVMIVPNLSSNPLEKEGETGFRTESKNQNVNNKIDYYDLKAKDDRALIKELPENIKQREIYIPGYNFDSMEIYSDSIADCNLYIESTDEEFEDFLYYLSDDVEIYDVEGFPKHFTAEIKWKSTGSINHSMQIFRTNMWLVDYSEGTVYIDGDPGCLLNCYIDATGKYVMNSWYEIPDEIMMKYLEPRVASISIKCPGVEDGEYTISENEAIAEYVDAFHQMNATLIAEGTDDFKDVPQYTITFASVDGKQMEYIFAETGNLLRDNKTYLIEGYEALPIFSNVNNSNDALQTGEE